MARKVQNTEVYRKDKAQIAVRLTAEQVTLLDGKLPKGTTRASFARVLLLNAIGWNAPPKPPRKR